MILVNKIELKRIFIFSVLVYIFFINNFLFALTKKSKVSKRQIAFELLYQDEEFFSENFLQLNEEEKKIILDKVNERIKKIIEQLKIEKNVDIIGYINNELSKQNGLKESIKKEIENIIEEREKPKDKLKFILWKIKKFKIYRLLNIKKIFYLFGGLLILIIVFFVYIIHKFENESLYEKKNYVRTFIVIIVILIILALLFRLFKENNIFFPKAKIASQKPIIEEDITYKIKTLYNEEYYKELLEQIKKAEKTIKVLMYLIKYNDKKDDEVKIILDELIKAKKRGVKVTVVLSSSVDELNEELDKTNRMAVEYLQKNKIRAYINTSSYETHNKLVIIDDKIILLGNHNWSYSSLFLNDESSVLLIADKEVKIISDYFENVLLQFRQDNF
ncbi:MAG TPA: phospholipase D-like domain-containing protein [bacterium]|nr:phospholipase D-like domain-containing protein [bacterium]HOL47149.1 phospholipase D-like domain-containing protein [bacterium]HPQ18072.1 phospholipase D-like domain-containing protein [bacterium]